MNNFAIGGGRCSLTFKNGYRVSLYNGFGSYTDNKFDMDLLEIDDNKIVNSTYCEIAVIRDGKFVTSEITNNDDSVIGYASIEDVIDILNKVSKL